MRFGLSHIATEGIFLSASLFFLSFLAGAFFGSARILPTNTQPPIYYILAVNLGLCLLMLLSGLLFGIPSTALLIYNGYRFGTKLKSALIVLGVSETVMRLFPHIFSEIIAIVLSASVGTTVLLGFIKKESVSREDLISIAGMAVAITIISSYLEVYVTYKAAILSEVIK